MKMLYHHRIGSKDARLVQVEERTHALLDILQPNVVAYASPLKLFGAIRNIHDDEAISKSLGSRAISTIAELGLTWDENASGVCRLFADLGVTDGFRRS